MSVRVLGQNSSCHSKKSRCKASDLNEWVDLSTLSGSYVSGDTIITPNLITLNSPGGGSQVGVGQPNVHIDPSKNFSIEYTLLLGGSGTPSLFIGLANAASATRFIENDFTVAGGGGSNPDTVSVNWHDATSHVFRNTGTFVPGVYQQYTLERKANQIIFRAGKQPIFVVAATSMPTESLFPYIFMLSVGVTSAQLAAFCVRQ